MKKFHLMGSTSVWGGGVRNIPRWTPVNGAAYAD